MSGSWTTIQGLILAVAKLANGNGQGAVRYSRATAAAAYNYPNEAA